MRRALWDFLNIHSVGKLKGSLRIRLKISRKKVSQSRKNMHEKLWSRVGIEPTSFCFADIKNRLTSKPSGSRYYEFSVSVAVLVEATACKLTKSVTSLVSKKASAIVCVFFGNRLLKIKLDDESPCFRIQNFTLRRAKNLPQETSCGQPWLML